MVTELRTREKPAGDARRLTAAEFFQMPGTDDYELIDGQAVPKYREDPLSGPGGRHGKVATRIAGRLDAFVSQHRLGDVYVETGFIVRHNPDTVRRTDVSFLTAARLPEGTPEGFPNGPPTLAVEILSPGDTWAEVEDKVDLYFHAGAQVIWIVDAQRQVVTARTPKTAPVTYVLGETIPGGDILPGFELAVSDIFA